jgi:phage gpG-like protein
MSFSVRISKNLPQIAALRQILNNAPRAVGQIAVNHYKDNFRKQGFDDNGVQPWKPRKNDKDTGRGILIGKQSGKLRDSIQVVNTSPRKVILGANVPYARVHNQGNVYNIRAHHRANKHTGWASNRTSKLVVLKGRSQVKAHTMRMPRRQFMGASASLYRKFGVWFNGQVSKIK